MRKNINRIITLLLLFTSCKKEAFDPFEGIDVDHGGYLCEREMNIELLSPIDGDTIEINSNLIIQGEITGNFNLHGYSLRIYDKQENSELIWVKNKHTHGELIQFDEVWNNNLTNPTEIVLEVFAVGNHEGTMDMSKRISLYVK